jgi:hypothetical protein
MGKWGHGKSRRLYYFLCKRKSKSSVGIRIFVHHKIISAVKREEIVRDGIIYIYF